MENENGHKIKLLVLWDILYKNTDENHAMNADEIRDELAKRGISVIRRVVASDIATLNEYGYEVLSYKKKYTYYYVVNRPLETAEVVMLALKSPMLVGKIFGGALSSLFLAAAVYLFVKITKS